MKFQQLILSISFLLLLLPSLVVESSSSNDRNIVRGTCTSQSYTVVVPIALKDTTLAGNNIITRGRSSISVDGDIYSSYWPSSSGNFGFGFFKTACSSQDGPDEFAVGISYFKSGVATLVWSTNRHYHKPSSVFLNNEGKLVLRMNDKEQPLIPNIQEPVSFAMMHDNGNFVLYGSEGEIVWQSFDYPTHTILGGQKLRAGVDLISAERRLSVQDTNGLVAIHEQSSVSVVSDALNGSLRRPIFLSLSTTGDLYLVGSDGVVLKYLHRNKNQQPRQQQGGNVTKENDHLYIATLHSIGRFILYKESFYGSTGDNSLTAIQSWPIYHQKSTPVIFLTSMKHFFAFVVLCVLLRKLFSVAKAAAWKRMNRSPPVAKTV